MIHPRHHRPCAGDPDAKGAAVFRSRWPAQGTAMSVAGLGRRRRADHHHLDPVATSIAAQRGALPRAATRKRNRRREAGDDVDLSWPRRPFCGTPLVRPGRRRGAAVRHGEFAGAVLAVDVVAELHEAVGGAPAGDVAPVDRNRLRHLGVDALAGLEGGVELPRLQSAGSLQQPGARARLTFCTRMQPEETKREISPKRSLDGVSCM